MSDDGTAYGEIDYSVTDGVATIVLDREARMNAFTGRMCDELVAACDAIDADDAVRALVVTGRGRAFCAGADLGEGGSTFDDRGRDTAARYGEVAGVAATAAAWCPCASPRCRCP